MKIITILILLCGFLSAFSQTNSTPADKRLVEVSFAADDKPPTQIFHIVHTFYISEHKIGFDRFVYDWATQGGYSPSPEAHKKADECIKLLESLDEPKKIPDSPNQILTVRYAHEDKMVIKKFPIDAVPSKVHQVLTIIGCRDDELKRIRFVK